MKTFKFKVYDTILMCNGSLTLIAESEQEALETAEKHHKTLNVIELMEVKENNVGS